MNELSKQSRACFFFDFVDIITTDTSNNQMEMDEAVEPSDTVEKDADTLIFHAFLEYHDLTNLAISYYIAKENFFKAITKATTRQGTQ